jgi:Uma2 family endonuclease
MRVKLAVSDQLTIEEFLDFTSTRPSDEKWELIEGIAIMQDSPSGIHQVIAGNIYAELRAARRRLNAHWYPLLGIGTKARLVPNSLPEPDVMVKAQPATSSPFSEDALVVFEVWSPSNTKSDKRWKLRFYSSLPNCQHYVTVDQDTRNVVRHDRANGWKPAPALTALAEMLELPTLGCALLLSEIYLDTPLGDGAT